MGSETSSLEYVRRGQDLRTTALKFGSNLSARPAAICGPTRIV